MYSKSRRTYRRRYAPYRKYSRYRRYGRVPRSVYPKKEVKKFTLDVTESKMAAAGTITLLSQVVQGLDVINRLGNLINAKYMSWRCQYFNNADGSATTGTPVILRHIIFQDMENSASTPTVSGTPGTSVLAGSSVDSHLNVDTVRRYKILFDRTFAMNSGANNTTAGAPLITHKFMKCYKRFYGLRSVIGYTSTDAAGPAKGNIHLLSITNVDTNGSYNGEFRLGFIDP